MTTPAATERYAVIGNPVTHSRSPAIHAAFAAQLGQTIDYQALPAPLDGFADTVRAFATSGARGCNVTVPFKFEAAALCARVSARAQLAEAVNTLRFDADGWFGDNTDGVGLMRDIEVNAAVPITGLRVLLLGAGGAAAGVLGPLLQARPRAVLVANRTAERADELAARHRDVANDHGVELRACALAAVDAAYDVVINATASSLGKADVPVVSSVLRRGGLAVDLMYGAASAPFIAWAEQHGAVGRDGLGMLVEQAAEAYALWRGTRPQTAPILAALRRELAAAQ